MSAEQVAAYHDVRERLTQLGRTVDAADLERPVPATPEWRVRDVVGHLVGIVGDLLAGNLADVGSDPWTAAQVDARRDQPFAAVLDEWDRNGPALEAQVASLPDELTDPLVADAAMHDLDVRGALGRSDGRDAPAVGVAFRYYCDQLGTRLNDAGAGALRLVAGGDAQVAGRGEPLATVTAPRFELTRALCGRRSDSQIRALTWDGAWEPLVALLASYSMRATPLVE